MIDIFQIFFFGEYSNKNIVHHHGLSVKSCTDFVSTLHRPKGRLCALLSDGGREYAFIPVCVFSRTSNFLLLLH